MICFKMYFVAPPLVCALRRKGERRTFLVLWETKVAGAAAAAAEVEKRKEGKAA